MTQDEPPQPPVCSHAIRLASECCEGEGRTVEAFETEPCADNTVTVDTLSAYAIRGNREIILRRLVALGCIVIPHLFSSYF